jgi:protein-tyrosine phosphatase
LESAGTGDWHVGQLPDPRTIAVLKEHGITEVSRARQVTRRDLSEFDLIVVMDEANYADIEKWGDRAKVRFATDWLQAGSKEPVPDPYYGGPQEFLSVFQMLDEITDRILFDLKAERA